MGFNPSREFKKLLSLSTYVEEVGVAQPSEHPSHEFSDSSRESGGIGLGLQRTELLWSSSTRMTTIQGRLFRAEYWPTPHV